MRLTISAPAAGAARKHAQSSRPLVQNFVRKNGHQRGCAAQEHYKQVQRTGTEKQRRTAHVMNPASTTLIEAARCSILPGRT
jgi:hypothetical protein